ncbi:lanthionine synthetase LanC family protein [Bernardetia sp.]|uniref:lanthionine synthetase LanC family protein n=1 Tax=Bernardetia sp. TaxID=1937974 RepID=UPI0025BC90B4|nr:lanthionine synthetase LanC family protein [Bernardetia sp.]
MFKKEDVSIYFDNQSDVFFQNSSLLGNLGSLYLLGNIDASKAEKLLEEFYKEIQNAPFVPSNIYGLSGIGLLLSYLDKVSPSVFASHKSEFIVDFADDIYENALQMAKDVNYDTFEGLVSVLNFFIAAQETQKVHQTLLLLQNTAQKLYDADKLTDLGLAHGICGIIAGLCKGFLFLKDTLEKEKKEQLQTTISTLTEYLLSHSLENNSYCFPMSVGEKYSRLAWCYGDLSVAVALTWVALVLPNNQKIREKLYSVLENAIELADAKRNYLVNSNDATYDLGICHGLAGNCLIFKRINEIFPKKELQTEIKRLEAEIAKVLEKNKFNTKLPIPNQANEIIWQSDFSLLEGLSGVLLLYFDDEIQKGWDSFLLTDFPANF